MHEGLRPFMTAMQNFILLRLFLCHCVFYVNISAGATILLAFLLVGGSIAAITIGMLIYHTHFDPAIYIVIPLVDTVM